MLACAAEGAAGHWGESPGEGGGEAVPSGTRGERGEERALSGVLWEEGSEGVGGRCGRGNEGVGPGGEGARGDGDGAEEEGGPTAPAGEDHALEACA